MADHVLNSSAEVASKAISLRAELKTWEKEFASTHDGRKAGREDIKQHPDIAAKYKEYGRLKALESSLSRRENRQESSDAQSRKRKHASPTGPDSAQPVATPRKSAKGLFATPSNNRNKHINHVDEFVSPSTFRKLFSPSAHRQSEPAPSPLKAAIGPTPQRDGKALGLFDMLSESGGSNATPSAKKQKDFLAAGFLTPSKPKTSEPMAEVPEEEEESTRLSRTPASSTKQFYLANLFATPTTMRYAAMVEKDDDREDQENTRPTSEAPASPEPNTSETPSFLRRTNFNRLPPPPSNDQSAGLSPIASRKPLQFAGKGLSHLVQGLRAMEEEREDDEWDMLREIEAEQEAANLQVPQSQVMPDNQRPYKKKGQKRTTRRVIMRPVAPRPKLRPNSTLPPVEEYPESDDEIVAVPETQLPAGSEVVDDTYHEENIGDDVASLHTMSDPESDPEEPDADSDDDPEYGEPSKPLARAKSFSERIREAVSMAKPPPKEEPLKAAPAPEKAEKAPKTRMIKANSQAHTNYRSLKIHHRGGSRGRGRFCKR
ncbi:DNA replication regulator sld2 [Penicillium cataractarum]|uniref:DNA replication regulator SLD2 n=1 Tax=Penicillium cataractarum TaxID=2100454 RepID=A0A9W9SGA9_9EURO|nr:DNA replication regulator sld2 [Penicillium cataractarum]KAJ5377582.1 DNA replication regulator sld2 [Penicillium cataractarum]